MRISNENWTVVVEKFGNPTSFVFHLAHLVIKLKYDPPEGEPASLTKAKTTCGGGGAWLCLEGGRRSMLRSNLPVVRSGAFVNNHPRWMK
ncbi:hypothetical protein AVEN_58075-1 [Araneus ventricosus]|uniref:Uncharacterized protein n=1 Tax=Araneus ventricosus TaxID=182803 RepID=A0A4Y2S0N6_ARAVE|nr:hypothetical protein AVEN_58075-1 [Araneus ventricosus]